MDEPRFIQTLHRRGYRLLVPVVEESTSPAGAPEQSGVVGREQELLQLDELLNEALAGSRQMVFTTGEAGLGKTTVIDQFARRLQPNRVSMVRGHCLPQFGGGEPFLPVFEALGQLSRRMGRRMTEVLRTHAPSWLVQMPALVSAEDRAKLQTGIFGSSPERMVREMVAALEALSLEVPLVLVLEDLHWSDPATINLLSAIAARNSRARLMVLTTYRPEESGAPGSLLRTARNEMELHRQCRVAALRHLSERDTADYLATRFPDAISAAMLAPALHQRTNGNPLHLVCLTDELQRTGKLDSVRSLVPDTLQQKFERQAAQCSAHEQELLDAAAVAGGTFSVVTIASALGWTPEKAEFHCEELVRQRAILRRCLAPCSDFLHYSFAHSLCRDALYLRIPAGRRARLESRLDQVEHKDAFPVNVPQVSANALFDQRSCAAFA